MLHNPYRPRASADPLIGRQAQLALAQQFISQTLATRHAAPGAVVFYGVRGIGKTSLLRAVRRRAISEDGFVSPWLSVPKGGDFFAALAATVRRTLVDADVIAENHWSLERFGVEVGAGPVKVTASVKQPTPPRLGRGTSQRRELPAHDRPGLLGPGRRTRHGHAAVHR